MAEDLRRYVALRELETGRAKVLKVNHNINILATKLQQSSEGNVAPQESEEPGPMELEEDTEDQREEDDNHGDGEEEEDDNSGGDADDEQEEDDDNSGDHDDDDDDDDSSECSDRDEDEDENDNMDALVEATTMAELDTSDFDSADDVLNGTTDFRVQPLEPAPAHPAIASSSSAGQNPGAGIPQVPTMILGGRPRPDPWAIATQNGYDHRRAALYRHVYLTRRKVHHIYHKLKRCHNGLTAGARRIHHRMKERNHRYHDRAAERASGQALLPQSGSPLIQSTTMDDQRWEELAAQSWMESGPCFQRDTIGRRVRKI